jgi:hypothetical protein
MKSRYSSLRTLQVTTFLTMLIVLFMSSPILATGPLQDVKTRLPRIDVIRSDGGFLPSLAPTATIESSRVVHRVKYNNAWWMRIHVKFRIKNALSTPCKIYAYFYDDEDDEPLGAGDGYPKYTTPNDNVYTALDFTPSLNDAVYSDLQLYIPYEALNLETEKGSEYDLKYFLAIRNELTKKDFAKSTWFKFSLKY